MASKKVSVTLPHWTQVGTWLALLGALAAVATALHPGLPSLTPYVTGGASLAAWLVSMAGTIKSGKGPLLNRILNGLASFPLSLTQIVPLLEQLVALLEPQPTAELVVAGDDHPAWDLVTWDVHWGGPTRRRRFGRLAAKRPVGLRDLVEYLTNPLPDGPAQVPVPPVKAWGMFGNDTVGDCTIAGVLHDRMADAADHEEQEKFPTSQEAVAEYFRLTGGQDTGLVEADLLQTWQRTGLFGQKLVGYAPVDHRNFEEIRSVVAAFGACYLGIVVPSDMESQFDAYLSNPQMPGPVFYTTKTSTLTQDGHCVVIVGYNEGGPIIATWGAAVQATWAWLELCLEEAWALLTAEDARVDLAALQADLAKLA